MARPQNKLAYGGESDIAALAAAYAYGIIRNHPFVDGNKRMGYAAARAFLLINGFDIEASHEEKYEQTLALAKGESSEDAFGDWIRRSLVAL